MFCYLSVCTNDIEINEIFSMIILEKFASFKNSSPEKECGMDLVEVRVRGEESAWK